MLGPAQRPEMGDQTRMPFTMAVIHEVQRFGDLVPLGMPHMTSRDIEVQGFHIPKVGLHTHAPAQPRPGKAGTGAQVTQCSFPQARPSQPRQAWGMGAEAGRPDSSEPPVRGGTQTEMLHSVLEEPVHRDRRQCGPPWVGNHLVPPWGQRRCRAAPGGHLKESRVCLAECAPLHVWWPGTRRPIA